MNAVDPVQAVAEALHADQCPDDECDGGDMGEYDRMAEIAVAEAEPHLTREAKAEAWDEGFDAGHQAARAVNPEWPEQPTNPYRIEADTVIEREGQAE